MKHIPLAILSFAVTTAAFAKTAPVSPPKDTSYSLAGIVDDDASKPFACMLGNFKVKVVGKRGSRVVTVMEGAGFLMNSGYLHTSVASNPEITYRFPEGAKVEDGMRLSLYCNEDGEPGKADISYFVPHQN